MKNTRSLHGDDSGMALFTVIMMSTILFLLVTSLLVLQGYYVSMVQLRSDRMSATHIADAGLNDYLYQIKKNSTYYLTVPDTGWTTFGGGRYRVVAVAPGNGNPLTLYSTGSADSTTTLVATVRYPTFADYMFLSDGYISFGSGALVDGQVRSNDYVENDGHITGKTFAVTSIYGTGLFDQGKVCPSAPVNFGLIDVKMDDIMTAAQDNSPSSYFAKTASGSYGYRVTFNGSTYLVERVTGGTTTGNLTTVTLGTYTIPVDGALYFDDTVWVRGNYGANVTLVSSVNIYIMDSYRRTVSTASYSSGLISKNNIIVPSWYASVPQDMVIEAAVLAKSGQFYADMKAGVFRNTLRVSGAITDADSTGGFVTTDWWGRDYAGFHSRSYLYDQRLNLNPPPYYPPTGDGALKVTTWVDQRGITP